MRETLDRIDGTIREMEQMAKASAERAEHYESAGRHESASYESGRAHELKFAITRLEQLRELAQAEAKKLEGGRS